MAHQQLDAAVAAAYEWADYTPEITDEEILKRLLALNLKRSQPTAKRAPTSATYMARWDGQ